MITINATLIVQIIHLLILIVILNWLMYKPLRKLVDERRLKVAQGLAEAEQMRAKAQELKERYDQEFTRRAVAVRHHLVELEEQARAEAREMILATREKARQEYLGLVERLEKELAGARDEIRAQAELVAGEMAKRILGRELQ